jgi:hypothetical protein
MPSEAVRFVVLVAAAAADVAIVPDNNLLMNPPATGREKRPTDF